MAASIHGESHVFIWQPGSTAVLEVRPLIGSYVSVAQFKVLRDIRLVNCADKPMDNLARWLQKTWTPKDIEKAVWSDINRAFSRPVERGDNSLDYVPTQIIAEAFKLHGYDGIAYKSSYGEDGFNVALILMSARQTSLTAGCIASRIYRSSCQSRTIPTSLPSIIPKRRRPP